MDIGSRIKYFRQKQNITVNKLANLAGISQSYLRDVELGNKQPTVEYLSYICDALGVSLSQFFQQDSPLRPLPKELEALNDEQLHALCEFVTLLTR